MPFLTISQPSQNQVVAPGQPFQVSGQASDKGMPEPIMIDSVTFKIDNGPSIDVQLTLIKSPTLTLRAFSAMATVSGVGPHLVTVTATNDQGLKATENVTVYMFPQVLLPPCHSERDAGTKLEAWANQPFTNWPKNVAFTVPMYYVPKTLDELAYAILQAESAGHHVRAVGSAWSFSDATFPTDSSQTPPTLVPVRPGAVISTSALVGSLQTGLRQILALGVDATSLVHVEAGITISNLNALLDRSGQTLDSGGGSGQTLAGVISTSTHGGDSLVPPLADYVCAIHLVGAGGLEHWIEPDPGITNPTQLQVAYPCLASENIHYDTSLFNALLVSGGSMGVIYSVILKTVPQFGLAQHRVATTWEALLNSGGPNMVHVMDGSFMAAMPGTLNILDGTTIGPGLSPFTPNRFSQVVINPYPLESNDGTLSAPEKSLVGQHLCFVTNRVTIPVPTNASNPGGGDISSLDVDQVGHAARNSLGSNVLDYDIRFANFENSLTADEDLSTKAALLVNFLAQYYDQRTISAVIASVLKQIMPVGDRIDVSYKLSDVLTWGDSIRSLSVEAAFTVSDALTYVPKVLALVEAYATRTPRIYIAGYLSLRFVGKKTAALLGMQQWSPTCCVEYAMLSGSNGVDEFVIDLQKLALASHGVLHWGQCNEAMTAADVQNMYGVVNVEAFRQARALLSLGGTLATFNNSFTDRLGLNFPAVDATPLVTLSQTNIDFKSVPMGYSPAPTATVTLTNTGSASLVITRTSISGDPSFTILGNQICQGATLGPGESCTVTIEFDPGGAKVFNATLVFTDNASNSPQQVLLKGRGLPSNT